LVQNLYSKQFLPFLLHFEVKAGLTRLDCSNSGLPSVKAHPEAVRGLRSSNRSECQPKGINAKAGNSFDYIPDNSFDQTGVIKLESLEIQLNLLRTPPKMLKEAALRLLLR